MGLSSMPSAADAFLPVVLLANAMLPIALVRDGVLRVVLQLIGHDVLAADDDDAALPESRPTRRPQDSNDRTCAGKIYVTRFSSGAGDCRCSICLHGYEADEEISEVVGCQHLFHRPCLDRWLLDHQHTTCPLCRSSLY